MFSEPGCGEARLAQRYQVYESQGLTPYQVGMRIWQHPTMQVTSPLKRRFASSTTIAQDYSFALEQTFKFPLRRLGDLALQAEANRLAVRDFLARLVPNGGGLVWRRVDVEYVLGFLQNYRVDNE